MLTRVDIPLSAPAPEEHLGLEPPSDPLPHQLGQQHGQARDHREPGPCPGLWPPLQLCSHQGLGSPWLHPRAPPREFHGLHLTAGIRALPGPSQNCGQSPSTSGEGSWASQRVPWGPSGGLWGRRLYPGQSDVALRK